MSTAVQDIEELQRGLRAVFAEVEADGDIGKITTAAVVHVGGSGDAVLARWVQSILRRTTPGLVVDGRIGEKTLAALRHLDELGDIESAAETPRLDGDRHVVKASSFADAADVRAFKRCKTRGGSDLQCFRVGDNGIGARGASCAQTDRPMIALPREVWRHDGATIATAAEAGTPYVITFAGRDLEAELGDTMPSVHNITNGAGMDTNPAVAAAFNALFGKVVLEAPFMVPMAWRLKGAKA